MATLDAQVRETLRTWPQRPPGLPSQGGQPENWLRGRPTSGERAFQPFLKFPGSDRLRTLPDGLWLHFCGRPAEIFVDIFAIEACGSLQNLLDKRSRFAPSTQSLLAVCSVGWLLAPMGAGDPTPRWHRTGVLTREPTQALIVPVRDIRVLFALKSDHYKGFAANQIPHPHEYYMPMDALMAANSDQDPALRALVGRASQSANFLGMA